MMNKEKKEIDSLIVKKYGTDAGADVVGIAASKDFGLAPDGSRPADIFPECLSIIVLGATFSPGVFKDVDTYTASRNEMVSAMTDMAKEVAKRIKADGYKTKAISATGGKWVEVEGKKEHFGNISLKHAAEIAGLGVIGKNYLLTNPKYGNLLWLSAVLTDAELTPDEKIKFSMCDNCNKCVESCPVGALDDPSSFVRKDCRNFFVIEDKKLRIKCYLCRTVCPRTPV